MIRFSLLLLLLCLVLNVESQNFIQNGSFEEHVQCPPHHSLIKYCKGWSTANTATPDYYNKCSNGHFMYFHYCQDAYDGDGFIGIYLYDKVDFKEREYVSTNLTSPLQKDSMYVFEAYLAYPEAELQLFKLNVGFSQGELKTKTYRAYNKDWIPHLDARTKKCPIPNRLDLSYAESDPLINGWHKVVGYYKAKGGEKILTIGLFEKEQLHEKYLNFAPYVGKEKLSLDEKMLEGKRLRSYIYLDNVSLTKQKN